MVTDVDREYRPFVINKLHHPSSKYNTIHIYVYINLIQFKHAHINIRFWIKYINMDKEVSSFLVYKIFFY